MARGLNDPVEDVVPEVSLSDVFDVMLSTFFAVDALNRKLDAVLVHVGLQEPVPSEVEDGVAGV